MVEPVTFFVANNAFTSVSAGAEATCGERTDLYPRIQPEQLAAIIQLLQWLKPQRNKQDMFNSIVQNDFGAQL